MNIERILLECRFSRRYRGYRELEECVKLALEKEERLLCVYGIYTEVGRKHNISASGVERNIRTLLNHAWNNGGKEPLERISGGKIYDRPSVSEVIEIITCYLKEEQRKKKISGFKTIYPEL